MKRKKGISLSFETLIRLKQCQFVDLINYFKAIRQSQFSINAKPFH